MIEYILIVVPNGSRFKVSIIASDGTENVLIDVESPKFETNDDGSKGKICLWNWIFDVSGMIYDKSRKRFINGKPFTK